MKTSGGQTWGGVEKQESWEIPNYIRLWHRTRKKHTLLPFISMQRSLNCLKWPSSCAAVFYFLNLESRFCPIDFMCSICTKWCILLMYVARYTWTKTLLTSHTIKLQIFSKCLLCNWHFSFLYCIHQTASASDCIISIKQLFHFSVWSAAMTTATSNQRDKPTHIFRDQLPFVVLYHSQKFPLLFRANRKENNRPKKVYIVADRTQFAIEWNACRCSRCGRHVKARPRPFTSVVCHEMLFWCQSQPLWPLLPQHNTCSPPPMHTQPSVQLIHRASTHIPTIHFPWRPPHLFNPKSLPLTLSLVLGFLSLRASPPPPPLLQNRAAHISAANVSTSQYGEPKAL